MTKKRPFKKETYRKTLNKARMIPDDEIILFHKEEIPSGDPANRPDHMFNWKPRIWRGLDMH